jgi:hypothetical protein
MHEGSELLAVLLPGLLLELGCAVKELTNGLEISPDEATGSEGGGANTDAA